MIKVFGFLKLGRKKSFDFLKAYFKTTETWKRASIGELEEIIQGLQIILTKKILEKAKKEKKPLSEAASEYFVLITRRPGDCRQLLLVLGKTPSGYKETLPIWGWQLEN